MSSPKPLNSKEPKKPAEAIIKESSQPIMEIYDQKIVVPSNWQKAFQCASTRTLDSTLISTSAIDLVQIDENEAETKQAKQYITMAKIALDAYMSTHKSAAGLFGHKTIRLSGSNPLMIEIIEALVATTKEPKTLASSQGTEPETDLLRIAINKELIKDHVREISCEKMPEASDANSPKEKFYGHYLTLNFFEKSSKTKNVNSSNKNNYTL